MTEAEEIFRRWMERTEKVLISEIDAKDVKQTEALKKGLKHIIRKEGQGLIRGEILFLQRGRFVDMGAGRKKAIEAFEGKRKSTGRKPKKWYSPAFYGRLNDLLGAIGIQFSEEAMEAISKPLSEA